MNDKTKKTLVGLLAAIRDFALPGPRNNFRARMFSGNFLIYFLFALVVVKIGTLAFFNFFPKSAFFADITKSAVINLANADRQKAGLTPLTENAVLDRAALMKAQDMMAKGYFEHTSPQGISPWYWFDQSGYDYRYAGENLAIGFIDSGEVNNAWLASPAHKANILNGNYRETGTAVLSGNFQGGQTTVVVQLFGTKTSGLFGKALVNQMPKPSPAAVPPAALAALSGQAMAQKVLGAYDLEGTTRSVLQTPDDGAIPYRVTSFLASGYFVMAQRIMYGSLFFIIIMLGLNFALKADFKHRDLLFKSIGFLVLLAMFLAMDKQMILALIPHLTVIS